MVRDEWRDGFAPAPPSPGSPEPAEERDDSSDPPPQRRVSGLPAWDRPAVTAPTTPTPPMGEWSGEGAGDRATPASRKKRAGGKRGTSAGGKRSGSAPEGPDEKRRVTVWVPARLFEQLREEKIRRGVTFTTFVLDAFDRVWDRLDELFPQQQRRSSPLPERRPGKRQSVEMPTQLHLLLTEPELAVIDGLGDRYVFASRSELVTTVVAHYLEQVAVTHPER